MFGKFWGLYYTVISTLEKVISIPKEIKWFIQRGRRGYSDQDVCNLDHYLSKVIANSIHALGKSPYICPEDKDNKKFLEDLKVIEETFRKANKLIHFSSMYEDIDKDKQYKKGWRLFQKHFFDLWD